MSYTTLQIPRTDEVEVTESGEGWEHRYTDYETVVDEKKALVCDCCPRIIGPVDDADPHATLMANATSHPVDPHSRKPMEGRQLHEDIHTDITNTLRENGHDLGGGNYQPAGKFEAKYHPFTSIRDNKVLAVDEHMVEHAVGKVLYDHLPTAYDGMETAIVSDGNLHFCESCAEEFDVPVHTGIEDSTVRARPDDASNEADADASTSSEWLGRAMTWSMVTALATIIANDTALRLYEVTVGEMFGLFFADPTGFVAMNGILPAAILLTIFTTLTLMAMFAASIYTLIAFAATTSFVFTRLIAELTHRLSLDYVDLRRIFGRE